MAKKITCCALFAVFALALSYLERLIPPLVTIPGIKLGLANIAVISVLYRFGMRYAFLVSVTRILLAGLLFGDLNSLFFSLCGGMLSFCVICLLVKVNCFGFAGFIAAGGGFHNIGQLAAASLVLSTGAVWYYLPVLLISGTITGILNGIISWLIVKRMTVFFKGSCYPV